MRPRVRCARLDRVVPLIHYRTVVALTPIVSRPISPDQLRDTLKSARAQGAVHDHQWNEPP